MTVTSASWFGEARQISMWSETADSDGNRQEQMGQLNSAAGETPVADRFPVVIRGSKGLNSAEGLGFGFRLGLCLGVGLGLGFGLRRRELAGEESGAEEEAEEPRTRPWPLNLELEVVRFFMNPFILPLTSSI